MTRHTARPAALSLLLACLAPITVHVDSVEGARVAKQWCANCHVIDGGAPAAVPQGPPSFRTIAGHLDPNQLRTFLTHPHGAMPDLALSRAEIEDLIAYITTLQ